MNKDFLEEQRSSPVDRNKAKAYMFFEIFQLLEEIKLVLAELLENFKGWMLVPSSRQSNTNKILVTLDSSIQTGNKAVNGIKVIV